MSKGNESADGWVAVVQQAEHYTRACCWPSFDWAFDAMSEDSYIAAYGNIDEYKDRWGTDNPEEDCAAEWAAILEAGVGEDEPFTVFCAHKYDEPQVLTGDEASDFSMFDRLIQSGAQKADWHMARKGETRLEFARRVLAETRCDRLLEGTICNALEIGG